MYKFEALKKVDELLKYIVVHVVPARAAQNWFIPESQMSVLFLKQDRPAQHFIIIF